MKKRGLVKILAVLGVAAILVGCGGRDDDVPMHLLVGAAASLTDVNGAIAAAFAEAHPNITLEFTHASSGNLQSQIEAGAPIDVFMSAAMAQMRNLDEQGLIYGNYQVLVRNAIALIVPADSTLEINGFDDLALDAVELVGVGDETVPNGNFAREVFDSYGILDIVNGKSVFATNVRVVLSWVEMGEVDAGAVFLTDAVASGDLVRIIAVAEPHRHSPSMNPVGIVSDSQSKEAAQIFIDFLFDSREIFEEFGFAWYRN
ncbi:MAG: molybdate ABC transporter substrate-binding protein [Defluviitaleaceae bacterium]|nr:molybdate ABC transporter substrate-binding protein [Defluviitaleaceae bacterium]